MAEQLMLDFGTDEPEPVALATFFDPILGAIQAPADLYK